MECFSITTQQALRSYAYPLDNKIFYIGKGKANRVFDHIYSKNQRNQYYFEGSGVQKKEICDLYLNKKLDKSKGSANLYQVFMLNA